MPKMTIKQAIDRREKAQAAYGRAVREFRASHAELAALDRLLRDRGVGHHAGFGSVPDATDLRHAIAAPDESGSLAQDADKVFSTLQIEG
jgi:hypothetical protein